MVMKHLRAVRTLVSSAPAYVFVATAVYYASLYFSVNNRTFLILTGIYTALLWGITRGTPIMWYLLFFVTLPFTKGRAQQIVLLPFDQIRRWTLYPVTYFFPMYVSDVFLLLGVYAYIKTMFRQTRRVVFPAIPLVMFVLFILWALFGGISSAFPEVGIFSAIQLIRLFVILCLPAVLFGKRDASLRYVYAVAAAALLFESAWALLQWVHGGPLGRDIEVYLPGAQFGIRSSENTSLLRMTGTFFEPSILGTFLLMQGAFLGKALVSGNIRHRIRVAAGILLFLASAALVVTGSRVLYGVWTGLCLVLIWQLPQRQKATALQFMRRNWRRLAVIGAAAGAMFAPYIVTRLSSLSDVFTTYGSATYRLQMMVYAFRIALSHPLFGVGASLSPYYYATSFIGERYVFDPTYPHNLLFQLFMETGMVGTLLFVVFFLSFLRQAYVKHEMTGPLLAACMYMVCAMFYPLFINQQEIASYLFVFLGLHIAFTQRRSGRVRA